MMTGRAVAIAAVASGVVTAAVAVHPASGVLYGQPELASSLETAAFAATLLAVFPAFGRLRRERTRSHLMLLRERQRIACDLRERASSVGGDLRVSSVPGQGTEVVASL